MKIKFFPQSKSNTCNIIAIQHVLSFFNQYPTPSNIKKQLPKHTFGDFLQEIGIYLDKQGIKTTLISNFDYDKNKSFIETLNKYKRIENFQDIIPNPKDIGEKPIIVNVDALKILKLKGKPKSHYIVMVKEKGILYMYDGANFKRKVKRTFQEIYKASLNINKFHENGMWLIIK